jgi:predicted nucleic acid-binding protein
MTSGRRRSLLLAGFESLLDRMGYRIAAFDAEAAEKTADLMADRKRRGRPGDLRDSMIAGIVLARHAKLATRNTRHFEDLSLPMVNPWVA